jgi:imidazolonepropionase-like amidohydrolase
LRVLGEIGHVDIALKEVFDTRMLMGPRLFVAGEGITSTGGHGYLSGGFLEADGAEEFRRIARKQLRAGADFIKIIATGGIGTKKGNLWSVQLSPEEIRAASEVAHKADTYIASHASGPGGVIVSVENGVDCIEHGFVLNDEAIEKMANHGTVFVPTLTVTWAWNEDFMRKNDYEEWVIRKAVIASKNHLIGFKKAVEAGIPVVAGSDELPSDYYEGAVALVKEIEIMSQNGLSNMEAIQAATLNGAKLCRVENQLGTLTPAKWADLIAVQGNPLEDITSLRNLRFVMKGGEVIPCSDHGWHDMS